MSTSRFGRWDGLAAVAGGALWVVVFAIHAARSSAEGSDEFYVSLHGLGIAGLLSVLLVAVGFVGLDMHMPSEWGGPGLGQNGRMGEDYERLPESSEAFVYVAMSRLMARRLARS